MIATEFDTARPAIPGLRFRHFAGPEDYPGMAGVNMAARRAANVEEAVTVEMLANQYAHPTKLDTDRDLLVVELDGRIVYESCGFATVRSSTFWRKPLGGPVEAAR
jgi:hypothetical protein